LTTPNAIDKKFLGFEDGRLLKPSELNFAFASLVVKPLNLSGIMIVFSFSFFIVDRPPTP
jgi:hypothetical protein